MIKDTIFVENITTHKNYLGWCHNSKNPVNVVDDILFLELLTMCYESDGGFVYEIRTGRKYK